MNVAVEAPERLSRFVEALLPMRERLLANLVMIAQISVKGLTRPVTGVSHEQRFRICPGT